MVQVFQRLYDIDRCEIYGGAAAIQMSKGNFEAAHTVIDKAKETLESEELPTDPMEWSLCDAGISLRVLNAIEENFECLFVRDFVERVTVEDMFETGNVGPEAVAHVHQCLLDHGIAWGELPEGTNAKPRAKEAKALSEFLDASTPQSLIELDLLINGYERQLNQALRVRRMVQTRIFNSKTPVEVG